MATIKALVGLSLILFFLAVVLLPFNVVASHNSCRIKAVNNRVYVRIFDVDRSGNVVPDGGSFLSEELWKGWLQEGESKAIKSRYGRIRYSYKSESDFRTYGNNAALCFHGETIKLP